MGILISNALSVLPDGEGLSVDRHDIYVDGTDIAGIDEAPAGFVPSETIDGTRLLAIPGLVNAHTHTYMSMMRNAADDLAFADWLMGTVEPIEDRMEATDAYWGSLLTQIEMIRSGTTCFNDQQMHIGQTTAAVRDSGMRAVISRGLVGEEYDDGDRRLSEARQEMAEFAECDRLSFRLGPHAPYSCGPEYLRLVADVAWQENLGIHIHIAESQFETETIRSKYGCTPVEYVLNAGIFEVPTIAAHCIRLEGDDFGILAENGVSVVTCPASNMKLGNGFAPVPEMMGAGINVCLGTDGAASNNSQSMIREMGLVTLIHKGTHDTPQCVSATDAFLMATRNAARALGLPVGSLEVGRKADIALLDLDAPSLTPLGSPVAALSYSANGSEVDTVIIDGRPVMRHRELLTIDEERVRHEMGRICQRLGLGVAE